MTNYNLKPPSRSFSLAVTEKKAARKKLLDEVRARRAENYKRFLEEKKRGLYAKSEMV
jgi:hypothetical protein